MSPIELSKVNLRDSASLDPELQEFLDGQPRPDPPFTDVEQCRTLTEYADSILMKSLGPLPSNLKETLMAIPVSSTHATSAVVVRPMTMDAKGPLIIVFHPSGWFVPSFAKVIPHARGLATLFGATVVCPKYRLAPEHPFPTGVDDAWAAVQWAATDAASLGADPSKGFILGGISTGAKFAVVLARRAVECGLLPPVTGLWAPLFIGFNDVSTVPEAYRNVFESRDQNRDAIVINDQKAHDLLRHYKPDFGSPLSNPLSRAQLAGKPQALSEAFNLGKLPKAYIQVAGADLFRDDGVVLAYALQDCGVPVKFDFYPGMPHSFWLFAPDVTASKRCFRDIAEGFAWLLDVDVGTLPEGWETLLASIGCQPNLKLESEFINCR